MDEFASYPRSEFADQVDAASLAYMELVRPSHLSFIDDDADDEDDPKYITWVSCSTG